MTGFARPSDLPPASQRIVAWCIAGWMLVAEPAPRGRRYRLDPPVPAPPPNRGPYAGRAITPAAAETAIASRFLVGRADGLFGDTALSWVIARGQA